MGILFFAAGDRGALHPRLLAAVTTIDYAHDRVVVEALGRRVAITRGAIRRIMYSQAGKDWSEGVIRRYCAAALVHPGLLRGVTVLADATTEECADA